MQENTMMENTKGDTYILEFEADEDEANEIFFDTVESQVKHGTVRMRKGRCKNRNIWAGY